MGGISDIRPRWLPALSIAQKLYLMIAILAAGIVCLFVSSFLTLDAVSSVRAYVGGESLWSKAQKQAVYRLSRYVQTRNELDYHQFLRFLDVNLGDRQAREELQKPMFSMRRVSDGFIRGGNHPDDIPGMIRVFRRFRHISYFSQALSIWIEGDALIDQLLNVGARMQQEIRSGHADLIRLFELLGRAESINAALTPLENDFSAVMGEAARELQRILIVTTGLTAAFFLSFGLLVSYSIARQLSGQLNRLRDAAIQMTRGDESSSFDVKTNDEIGDLGRAFEGMMRLRNRSEAEILALNQELEKRVAELRFANKELESFSYSVSHDLRAPLRAIGGFSRIVTEEHGERMTDDGRRLLGLIQRNVEHMSALIDGLLSFSRLNLLPLQSSRLDMQAMVQEVVAELKAVEPGRSIEFETHRLGEVRGDATLLRHVWINLLSNAVKFTRQQSAARIEIGQRDEAGMLVFYVRDNGAGFDMRYVDKLFGVFQRLHGVQEFEGTGIGLALVQRIVSRHGGSVWAEGRVNDGACFYFSLPAVDSEQPPSNTAESRTANPL